MRNQQQDYYEPLPQQSYAPPLALPSEKADLLDKIRPNLIVQEIFHRLLGEEEINGTWTPHPALKEKALSFVGAWNIATLMLPVSSQNVSLSKLKDNEIRARALSIAKTAQRMCLRNWKEYGIRGTDQLNFVHEIIFSNTFITLKQPQEEGIRKLLSNTMTGEILPPEQTQAGGMIQSLFRR